MEIDKGRVGAVLISAIISISVVGILIIVHEESSALKDFLIALTGHHWLTKSIIAAVLFPLLLIVFYFILGSEANKKRFKSDNLWTWSLILFFVVIFFIVFSVIQYTLHYFGES